MAVLERGRPGVRSRAYEREAEQSRLSLRLLAGVLALVSLAALLPLLQTSRATEMGGAIRGFEQERRALQARLHDGEAELAVLTSTARIRKEAMARLGMVPPERILYVQVDGPVPAPALPGRYLPPLPAVAPDSSDPWWQRLLDLLPFP